MIPMREQPHLYHFQYTYPEKPYHPRWYFQSLYSGWNHIAHQPVLMFPRSLHRRRTPPLCFLHFRRLLLYFLRLLLQCFPEEPRFLRADRQNPLRLRILPLRIVPLQKIPLQRIPLRKTLPRTAHLRAILLPINSLRLYRMFFPCRYRTVSLRIAPFRPCRISLPCRSRIAHSRHPAYYPPQWMRHPPQTLHHLSQTLRPLPPRPAPSA